MRPLITYFLFCNYVTSIFRIQVVLILIFYETIRTKNRKKLMSLMIKWYFFPFFKKKVKGEKNVRFFFFFVMIAYCYNQWHIFKCKLPYLKIFTILFFFLFHIPLYFIAIRAMIFFCFYFFSGFLWNLQVFLEICCIHC